MWAEQEAGGWSDGVPQVTSGLEGTDSSWDGEIGLEILAAYLYRPEAQVFRKEEQTQSLPTCCLLRGQGPG